MPKFPTDKLTACAAGVAAKDGRLAAASPPPIWTNLAYINAQPSSLTGAVAITVNVTIESGSVGVGILAPDRRTLIEESHLDASMGSTTIQLFAFDDAQVGSLLIRNISDSGHPIAITVESVEARSIEEQAKIEARKTLFAVYDFNILPLSYDFAFFLIAAEMARCDAGLDDIHIVFVPANRDNMRRLPEGFDAVVNNEGRQWRFFHILLPLLRLLPTVKGFSMPASRNEALAMIDRAEHRYAQSFAPDEVPIRTIYKFVNGKLHKNKSYQKLRATSFATKYVRQWLESRLKGRKLLVFTFRQYKLDQERNSDLASWAVFIRDLDKEEFFPVIVPDTEAAMDEFAAPFKGIDIFTVAAFNLELRAAIYEEAWLNMLTSGGPFNLACLSESCHFLIFKFLIPGQRFCSEEHLREMVNVPIDGQFPYHGSMQRIVWEMDSLDVIQREFAAMRAIIEDAEAGQESLARTGS